VLLRINWVIPRVQINDTTTNYPKLQIQEMLISLATNDKEKLHALSKLGINDAKAFLKSTV